MKDVSLHYQSRMTYYSVMNVKISTTEDVKNLTRSNVGIAKPALIIGLFINFGEAEEKVILIR